MRGDERMKPALIDTDILSLFFRNDLAIIEYVPEFTNFSEVRI